MKRADSDSKRMVIYVSDDTAAWLQSTAARDGVSEGTVVESARRRVSELEALLLEKMKTAVREHFKPHMDACAPEELREVHAPQIAQWLEAGTGTVLVRPSAYPEEVAIDEALINGNVDGKSGPFKIINVGLPERPVPRYSERMGKWERVPLPPVRRCHGCGFVLPHCEGRAACLLGPGWAARGRGPR